MSMSMSGKSKLIRLKSCHGRYLTASDESFLLGMTGKRVVLLDSISSQPLMNMIWWEPLKEGSLVKLRANYASGKFLRANGGTPPWRNSVTHDVPDRTATQDWILWDVEVVDIILSTDIIDSTSNFIDINNDTTTHHHHHHQLVSSSLASPISTIRRRKSRLSSLIFSRTGSGRSGRDSNSTSSTSSSSSISIEQQHHLQQQHSSDMELFERAKTVRLQGKEKGKYLVADEDEESVRQSRDGSSPRARWIVELVEGKSGKHQFIRLKSTFGKYLTGSDHPFVLGMTTITTPTRKKVVQGNKRMADMMSLTEWEPIKVQGSSSSGVKLMTKEGNTFLRANGSGTPPWRNSVTHDHLTTTTTTATQDSVLWEVHVLDFIITTSLLDLNPNHNLNNLSTTTTDHPKITQLLSSKQPRQSQIESQRQGGMEYFWKAKSVRLRSHHGKFLLADDNKETVCQDRHGTCKAAKWMVEFVDGCDTVVRLKSCYGRYLTAADDQFLLGVTGRKVLQTLPSRLDSKVEWEPTRDGFQVRLKTRYGNYLRANGGLPPWRNSITHDIPHRHTGWILWQIDIVEVLPQSPAPAPAPSLRSPHPNPNPNPHPHPPHPHQAQRSDADEDSSSAAEGDDDSDSDSTSFRLRSDSLAAGHSKSLLLSSSSSSMGGGGGGGEGGGRIIYYYVANEDGETDERLEESSFQFKGHCLEQLTQELEKETGVEDVIVCSRNQSNGNLYPLRLALPPNNATMHIIVLPATSRAARDFVPDAYSSSSS